jgi:hypothetical protein
MADIFDGEPEQVKICIVPSQREFEEDNSCAEWRYVDGWPFEIKDCPYHFAVTECVVTAGYVATNLETGARATKVYANPRDAAWYCEQNWKKNREAWIEFIEKHKAKEGE